MTSLLLWFGIIIFSAGVGYLLGWMGATPHIEDGVNRGMNGYMPGNVPHRCGDGPLDTAHNLTSP